MPAPEDAFPEHLEDAIRAFLDNGWEAGAKALEPIRYEREEMAKRPSLPRPLQGKVLRRDNFHCRYCNGRVIPPGIMELVGELYPDYFPFHPNWKAGETHPAFLSRSATVDHLNPGSRGGSWSDPDNLVTACWPCNSRKADFSLDQLGWDLRPIDEADNWDGLTCYYRRLWEAAGEPKPTLHRPWMHALGCFEDTRVEAVGLLAEDARRRSK